MATVYTSCPNTGREISTEIDIDADSFVRMPQVVMRIECPHCDELHDWSKHNAYLRDGNSKNPPHGRGGA
jgi:hypothetical protein